MARVVSLRLPGPSTDKLDKMALIFGSRAKAVQWLIEKYWADLEGPALEIEQIIEKVKHGK